MLILKRVNIGIFYRMKGQNSMQVLRQSLDGDSYPLDRIRECLFKILNPLMCISCDISKKLRVRLKFIRIH